MKKVCVCLPLAAVLLCGGWRASADDVKDVMKKIIEKTKQQKSFRAKFHMESAMSSEGFSTKSNSEGTVEWVRDGDKIMMRTELQSRSVTEMTGQPTQKSESKTLTIDDGEFSYNYSETNGEKTASKSKPAETTEHIDDPFSAMREYYDFSLVPEEKIDGQACYVIVAKPKAGSPMAAIGGRAVSFYRKSDAIGVKGVMYDAEDKPTTTSTYTDIKVDGKIDPDRFVFKAPPGVEVQDLTKEQPETAEQTQAQPEKKKEQPKKATEQKKPEKKIKLPKIKKKFP